MDAPLIVTEDVTADGATIRRVTMARPAVRNAMNTAMLTMLVDELHRVGEERDVAGVLVTGEGEHFSAGADLTEASPAGDHDRGGAGFARRQELFALAYELITTLRVPTAAAVEGWAVGGGAELAAACDVLVVGEGARLRFPGAIHGIPVGVARTVGRVGLGTARDWVLSSRVVDAHELHTSGFAQRLVGDGAAAAAAREWLEVVASRDAATVAVLKRHFLELSGLRDRAARENDALRAQAATGRLPSYDEDLPRTVRPRRA